MTTDIQFYTKLVMRRLPFMLAVVVLCAIVSAMIAVQLPKLYEAKATLLLERAQIPDNMVGVDLGLGGNQQFDLVRRRLLTRANLLDVAREAKAFPQIERMTPDEIVDKMRENTRIAQSSGRKSNNDTMDIGFKGPNPQLVARVVNEYVTIVLADNTDMRTSRAQGTLSFFEQEVERLSNELDLQSQKIVEFKNSNAEALPENFDFHLSRQSMLQERLARAEREIDALDTQRENLVRLYEATGSASIGESATPEEAQLRSLENELNSALAVYSEQNPKIRLLRTKIAALQEQVATQAAVTDDSQDATASTSPLDINLAEISSQKETLQQEIETVTAELDRLEGNIQRTPSNRITLEAMTREQENTRQLYAEAVRRLNQARMGERVETSARGERITLLEPANVPTQPSSPNMMNIIGLGTAMGLAISVGIFMLLEMLNQSIRRPGEIERKLEIKPLATLPLIETAAQRRRRRAKKLAVLGLVIVSVPSALLAVDMYYMSLGLLVEKIIERF